MGFENELGDIALRIKKFNNVKHVRSRSPLEDGCFSLKSFGDSPVNFLNTVLKVVLELKAGVETCDPFGASYVLLW
jgi:hypothetical protein